MNATEDNVYCSVKDCYNTPVGGSSFCIVHQNKVWFRVNSIAIYSGDSLVGRMTFVPEKGFIAVIVKALSTSTLLRIASAVNEAEDYYHDGKTLEEMRDKNE